MVNSVHRSLLFIFLASLTCPASAAPRSSSSSSFTAGTFPSNGFMRTISLPSSAYNSPLNRRVNHRLQPSDSGRRSSKLQEGDQITRDIDKLASDLSQRMIQLSTARERHRQLSKKLKGMIKKTRKKRLHFYDTLLLKTLKYNRTYLRRIKDQLDRIDSSNDLLTAGSGMKSKNTGKRTTLRDFEAKHVMRQISQQNIVRDSDQMIADSSKRIDLLNSILDDMIREKNLVWSVCSHLPHLSNDRYSFGFCSACIAFWVCQQAACSDNNLLNEYESIRRLVKWIPEEHFLPFFFPIFNEGDFFSLSPYLIDAKTTAPLLHQLLFSSIILFSSSSFCNIKQRDGCGVSLFDEWQSCDALRCIYVCVLWIVIRAGSRPWYCNKFSFFLLLVPPDLYVVVSNNSHTSMWAHPLQARPFLSFLSPHPLDLDKQHGERSEREEGIVSSSFFLRLPTNHMVRCFLFFFSHGVHLIWHLMDTGVHQESNF